MARNKYTEYLNRKQHEYGARFDSSELAGHFVQHYNSGARIEVNFVGTNGHVYATRRGTVGVTTGWRPCFLLILTARSTGSTWTLGAKDIIVRVVRKAA